MTSNFSPTAARLVELPHNLRELFRDCGTDRNAHAISGIKVSIDEGISTEKGIINMLWRSGLKPGHVAVVLKTGTGDNPARHQWQLRDGHFSYDA